jgi:formate-dependent nitrite reductase membrane component NrfD
MKYLNKLNGYVKYPAGNEWIILKKLPSFLLWGTLVCVAVLAYLHFYSQLPHAEVLKNKYLMLGMLFNLWFFIGTVAIGCVIVILMKGPAYVADPYELPKENQMHEENTKP